MPAERAAITEATTLEEMRTVEDAPSYKFTVFTPTFNRRHTLCRPYESLARQTLRDFEWLVVDDGSTDGTAELVRSYAERSSFPIRYCYQANAGKPTAINRGVFLAKGALFLILDSDDWCTPDALSVLWDHWIRISDRESFSGVTCRCLNQRGAPIGKPLCDGVTDAYVGRAGDGPACSGDRWGFHRTDVMRMFPFPRIPGEKFVTEGLIWNRIGKKYKMRFVNDCLRIVEYGSDGLSAQRTLRAANPIGARLYYKERLDGPLGLSQRLKATINYRRYSWHAHLAPSPAASAVAPGAEDALAWLGAACLWAIDRAALAVQGAR